MGPSKPEPTAKCVLADTNNVPFLGVNSTPVFAHEAHELCHGEVFVRRKPRHGSLISCVCENIPNAPKPTPTSATCCQALVGLMHIRNEAQSDLMKPADGRSLFSDVRPPKPKSWPRTTWKEGE